MAPSAPPGSLIRIRDPETCALLITKTVAATSYSSSRHLLRLKKSLRFHLPRFASRSAVCIFQESGLSTARFSLLKRKNRRSTRQRGVCLSDLFIVIECETRGCGTFFSFSFAWLIYPCFASLFRKSFHHRNDERKKKTPPETQRDRGWGEISICTMTFHSYLKLGMFAVLYCSTSYLSSSATPSIYHHDAKRPQDLEVPARLSYVRR